MHKLRVVPSHEIKESSYEKVGDGLFLHKKTGVYYIRKYFRRYKIPDLFASTRETKKNKARTVADKIIQEHLANYGITEGSFINSRVGVRIGDLIDEILRTDTENKRLKTKEKRIQILKELKAEWGDWDINRFGLDHWEKWLPKFKQRKDRETFFDYAKYMNRVINYAYERRKTSHLITIPNPDLSRKTTWKVYSDDEVARLWSVMNETLKDQFVLCFECMLRLREALYLSWDRVDLENAIITLRPEDVKTGSKTNKGRRLKLSPRALERMRARHEKATTPWVFPNRDGSGPINENNTAWTNAKKAAGISGKARWHDLRHTSLTTALLVTKVAPVLVSQYAGVSMRTIERVYLHSTHEKTAEVSEAVSIQIKKDRENVVKKGDKNEKNS